jgi:CO/xanthine dehydrogenase Mo-binding subunit
MILRQGNAGSDAEITLANGALSLREDGNARVIELASLETNLYGYVLEAEETYDPPTTPLDDLGQGEPYSVYGYGAQIAVVSVDMLLGTVKVERLIAAHDVGRAINPLLVEGQIQGGIAQGIGLALIEEYIPGKTENLHDYLIPTFGDVPEIESIIVEVPDPRGPHGAKGLGEHVLIPTAPAILNAIRDATDARIRQVPATPARVQAAIEEAWKND